MAGPVHRLTLPPVPSRLLGSPKRRKSYTSESQIMHRNLPCLLFIFVIFLACSRIPQNADPAERNALETLLPVAENVSWTRGGKVDLIHLTGNAVCGHHLDHIAALTSLRELNLTGANIVDADVAKLIALRHLTALSLQHTSVGADASKHLRKMTSLRTLDLTYTRVSDASIDDLGQLRNLERLFLGGTLVTETGAQQLRKSLPQCRVQK